jgi:hypothetical protein
MLKSKAGAPLDEEPGARHFRSRPPMSAFGLRAPLAVGLRCERPIRTPSESQITRFGFDMLLKTRRYNEASF